MIREATERIECKDPTSGPEAPNLCLPLPPIQSAYCYESRSVKELEVLSLQAITISELIHYNLPLETYVKDCSAY